MKCLWPCLLLLLAACSQEVRHTVHVKVLTHADGIRVYDADNNLLGLSPVDYSQTLVEKHDDASRLSRYYINDREVHPGEKWPLDLYVYSHGLKVPVTVMVPFDPKQLTVEVRVPRPDEHE